MTTPNMLHKHTCFWCVNRALQNDTYSLFLILSFASDLHLNFISPCSATECHMSIQSEKVSKDLLPRICQKSSLLRHCLLELARFLSSLSVFSTLCSQLLYVLSVLHGTPSISNLSGFLCGLAIFIYLGNL